MTESEESNDYDEALIESLWHELAGRLDREQIRQAVMEARVRYENASIKTYVPIFIRRHVLEKLQ